MTIIIVIITQIRITVYSYSLINTDGSKLQLFITKRQTQLIILWIPKTKFEFRRYEFWKKV